MRALEEAGVITGYTVLLDEKALGFELRPSPWWAYTARPRPISRAFENRVLGWPMVREAYMLSGESDYILKCVGARLAVLPGLHPEGADGGAQRGERQDQPRHTPGQARTRCSRL